MNKSYVVEFPDGTATYLNANLIAKQNVSDKNLDLIKHSHIYRWQLIKDMEAAIDDPAELQLLAKKIEEVDFYLQGLWGFEKNADFHKWWELPGCNCGIMDAKDTYGTSYRYYSSECPIHAWKQTT